MVHYRKWSLILQKTMELRGSWTGSCHYLWKNCGFNLWRRCPFYIELGVQQAAYERECPIEDIKLVLGELRTTWWVQYLQHEANKTAHSLARMSPINEQRHIDWRLVKQKREFHTQILEKFIRWIGLMKYVVYTLQ